MYTHLNIQPEYGFYKPKHVAVNYLKLYLIKVVLHFIYYSCNRLYKQRGCLA